MDDCDAFPIDNLLDFSADDIIGELDDMQGGLTQDSSSLTTTSGGGGGGLSSAFCGSDDVAPSKFEWLSNFVEETFSAADRNGEVLLGSVREEEERVKASSGEAARSSGLTGAVSSCYHFNMLSPVSVLESCATSDRGAAAGDMAVCRSLGTEPVPVITRCSKRGRPLVASRRFRASSSAGSSSLRDEEEEESDIEAASSSSDEEEEEEEEEEELEEDESSEDEADDGAVRHRPRIVHVNRPPPSKRQCVVGGGGGGGATVKAQEKPAENPATDTTVGRRCSHCLSQKTPQWRAGPLGPKTLCNACGVRYKSGRLLPEYRPAGSPTFTAEMHSNSHRKVLEMRKQREAAAEAAAAGGAMSSAAVAAAAAATEEAVEEVLVC